MPIHAILFDKDGTLIDFERTWGPATYEVIYTLADGNATHIAALAELSHFDLERRMFAATSPLISGSSADYGPQWAAALGVAADDAFLARMDGLFALHGRRFAAPFAGAQAAIEALSARGLALGVATNDAEASARAQLEVMGLTGHFPFVAGYDSGYGRKPGPGMVSAFATTLGLAPASIMMVGDSLHDLAAARAAGALAVAVTTGFAGADDLAPHADLVIATLAELVDHLPDRTAPG